MGFNHDAGTFVPCSDRVDARGSQESERRPVTYCQQFQRLLGLMAAASNVISIGLLYMRPLQWWLKTKGFFPRGNPLRMIKVTRRCLRALDMWRQPWFLSQGADILSIKRAGAEARGMDASPRGGEADLESVMARLRWTSSLLR